MTFAELVTLVRREIIVDQYDDAYSDNEILDVLWRASVEVAAAFDFPRVTVTVPVSGDAVQFAAPAQCARVHSVAINGDDLTPADLIYVRRMSAGPGRSSKYFNFDPRRADFIFIAPPSRSGNALVEYTANLVRPSPLGAAEPWSGRLPAYHSLIAYRAGVVLFQMDEREDEAAYWANEYQQRGMELAAFLGRSEMASVMLPPEGRNDEGAQS